MRIPSVREPPWEIWRRRLVAVPLLFLLLAATLALAPLALLVAVGIDLVWPRRMAVTRCVFFLINALLMEAAGVVGAGLLWIAWKILREDEPWLFKQSFNLQRWWGWRIYQGTAWAFSYTTHAEGLDALEAGGPILVLVRHTSTADTLLPIIFIGRPRGIHLRYVLKAELLWDPCLNIVAPRLGNAFVWRGRGDTAEQIRKVCALLEGLGDEEGVLIYPEGTRFTPEKRARALAHLEAEDPYGVLERARGLLHVLPPRLGGPLALLERNPGADVILCAHIGFDGINGIWDMLSGALIGREIRVKFWRIPYADLPSTEEARVDWLFDAWAQVDAWVGAQQEARARAQAGRAAPGG